MKLPLFITLSLFTVIHLSARSQGCPELSLDPGLPQTVCSGEEVVLGGAPTATWTGTGNPSLNYEWVDSNNDFVSNDPNPTIQIDQNETFTLTVDDGNGCSESIGLNISIFAAPPTPSLVLTNSAQQGYQTNVYNGEIYFSKCNNTSGGNFNIIDNQNYPTGTTFEIDWGDGSPVSSNLQPHVYTTGEYDLTYTVITAEGCVFVFEYYVLVGGPPPALTLSGSGSSSCIPNLYEISIGAGSDPPGTTYNIIINDGSQDTTLIGLNPNPYVFSHLFQQSSCGTNSTIQNNTYPDSYSIQVISSNGCSPQGTFSAIGPIQVSESSDAQFSSSSSEVCVDGIVNLQNNSDPGTNINSLGCDSLSAFYWEISPNIGYTIVNGDLGSSNGFLDNVIYYDYFEWTSGSENLDVEFNTEGIYDITLYTGNGCGIDSITQQICVLPQPTPDFQLSDDFFCTSEIVNVTNSSTGYACGTTFESNWQINYSNPQNCSPNSGVSFINSTSNSSFEPVLDFQGPGAYEVILTVSYPGNIPGCTMPQLSDSVYVFAQPEIQLIPQGANVCEGKLVQFNGFVNDCYALPTEYLWSFEDAPGIIISDTLTLNPTVQYGVSGVFDYSLEASNQCGSVIIIDSVSVDPGVIVDAGPDQATCLNTQINLNGSITGGANTGVWSANIPGGQFSDPNALISSYTPPVNFSGQIILSLISDDPLGPCPGNSDFLVLTINDEAVIDAMPDVSVCEGDVVDLNSTIQGAASEGIWNDAGAGGQVINEDLSTGSAQYIPPAGVSEVWLYVETNVPSVFCPADLDSVLITIISTPTVSIVPDQVVCNGLSTQSVVFAGTGTQYSWTNTDGSIGLVTNGVGDIGSFTATNNGQTPVTSLVTVTPEYVNGGLTCSGSTIDFSFTVDPTPILDSIADQTVCEGQQTVQVDFTSLPGSAFTWTNNNTQTGLSASGTGSVLPFISTNGTNLPISSIITVTATLNGCIGPTEDFTITVNPIASVDPLTDLDECSGTLVNIPFTGTGTVYNWTNDNFQTGLPLTGSGTIDFTTVNTGTTAEQSIVSVTPGYFLNGVLCEGNPEDFTITVQPIPYIDSLQDQTICNGDQTQLVAFTSSVSGTTYDWVNSNPSIGLASIGTSEIPSFTGINVTNTAVTGLITVTPTANGCLGPDSTLQFTIEPTPAVTNTVLSETICSNTSSSSVTWASSVLGTTYTWVGSVTSGSVNGFIASGSGNLPSMLLENTGIVPAIIEYTITAEANGCSGQPVTYTITVNPIPVLSPIPPEVICGGTSFTTPVFTSNVSGTDYTWILDQPGNIPLTITGYQLNGSGPLTGQVVNNSGSSPYTLDYIVIPTASGCSGSSDVFSLTVNPAPVVLFDITDQVICSGGSITPVNLSSSTPSATFDWSITSNLGGISGATPTQGGGIIPTMTLSHASLTPETITITAVATTTGGVSCPGAPTDYTITINPIPSVSSLTDQVVCNGLPTQAVTFNGTGTQYSWTNTDGSIGLGTSGIGDIGSFTAINNGQGPVTSLVTVTPEYVNGGLTCSGSPTDFSFTIDPTPFLDPLSDQTVCEGQPTTQVDFTSLPGSSFTWTNNNTQTGLSASGTGSVLSFNSANGTALPISSTVTVTPTLNGCIGPSEDFTITVNPIPSVDPLSDLDECSGTLVNIPFTGSGTVYNWTNDNLQTGLPLTGSGTIDFTTVNTGTTAEQSIISVTPGYFLNGVLCEGNPEDFTITVQPVPYIDALQDQTICNGDQTQLVTFTSSVSGTSYDWINSNPQIGLASNGSVEIPSFTGLNTSNVAVVGIITVTPTANGCLGPDSALQITIEPTPVVTNTVLSETICSNTSSSAVTLTSNVLGTTYTWTGSVTSGSVTGFTASGSGDLPSMLLENTGVVPAVIAYTIIPEANGCSGQPVTYTITVNPTPVLSPIAPEVICGGTSFTTPVFSSNVSVTDYTWVLDQPGNIPVTITGYQLNGTGPLTGQVVNNSGSSPYTLDYIVTPTASGCLGSPEVFSLTVNPAPVVLFDIADQVICSGSSITAVNLSSSTSGATFDWSITSNLGGISGATPTQGGGSIPSMTLSHSSLTPETITITAIATTTGGASCPGAPTDYTITINPIPSISSLTDQVVCNGLSTQSVIFAGTGTQYSWTNTDGSIGLGTSGIGDIGSFTAINNGQGPVISLVTVTPEYVNGGLTCSGSPTVYNYTINPTPVVDPIGDQELCIGDQSQVVIFSGTATNYNWSNDNTVTGAPNSGLNSVPSFIAQNSSTQVITSTITVTPESNGCIGIPIDFSYTVNPTTNVSPINDSIFCNGEQVSSYIISGSASSYSWTNNNPTIGLSSSGTGNIPTFTAVNNTSQSIDATITITPEFTGTTNSCSGTPFSFTITVQPSPIVNPIIDQTICNGSSTQTVQFSGTNASSYQWVNDNSLIGLPSSGNGNINSFTATNTASSAQVSTITVTPQLSVNGLICFGSPEDFLITVNPSPSVDPLSDIIVCEDQQVPVTVLSGNATSFDWTSSTNNTGVGTGGIGNIPSFTAINGTSQPVSDQIIVTPNFTGSGLSCPGVTSSFIITVNPVPIVDPVLDQVLCNGTSTNQVIFTGDATNYTWTNNLSAIGLAQTGNGNIPAFTVANSNTLPIDALITITPEFTSSGLTCSGNPEIFILSVLPTPEVDPLTDIVVCSSSDIGPIQFSGVATNYEWINSNSTIGLPSNGNGNISIFSYNNQGSSSESATIVVTPQYDYLGLSCDGLQESFLIKVLPEPDIDPISDFTYCNGASTSPINFNGLATEYSWTNDNSTIGIGNAGVGNILSFTAVNNSLSPEISTITITPNYTESGLTCNGIPEQFTITVNPAPIVNSVNDITVCNGQTVPLVDFSGNATVFEWFNDNTSIGLPNSGVGDITSFTAVNNSSVPIVATINVVSSFSSNGVNCPGPSETFTITVNPTPIVNPLVDQVICNAAPSATVNFTGSGSTYTWTNDNPNIGLAANGSGDISSFTAQNPTTNPIIGTITVIPTALQCDGSAEIFTITVNPTPILDSIADIENCAGLVISSIQPTGNFSTINWVNNNTTIGLANSGNTIIPSFTLSNSSNSTPNSATVSVTPLNTNQGVQCFGAIVDFQITVNPIPENNLTPDIELCNGDLTPAIQFAGSGTYYDWTNDNTSIGLGVAGSGDIASFSGTNNLSVDNISSISVTPVFVSTTGQLCEGTSDSFTLTVHPSPVIDPITDFDLCNGDNFSVPVITSVQSIVTWSALDNQDVTGESTFVQTTPIISNTLTNSSSTITGVAYTINATSVPFGCTGLPQTFDVNVIPDVFITSGNSMEICSGVSASVFLTANVPSDFTWFATDNPNVSGESTVINNGSVINDVLINTTNIPQLVVYSVIPTSQQGGCQGQAQTVAVIVNPPIELISPLSTEICSGDIVDLQLVANANVTFNWFAQSSLDVNGESLTVQNGNLINDQLINTTTTTQAVIYTVVATTTANGCSSPSTQINVFVNPSPVVAPFSEEICSGETLAIPLGASSPSIFSWFATDNLDVTGETQSLQTNSVITDQLINSTNNSETVTYNIQATSNKGCLGPVSTGEVIVHPIPEVDFSVSNTALCDLSPVNFVNNSSNLLDFDWSFGDGNTSNDFEPIHTYGVIGSYLVTLTGTDPVTLCEGSSSESILIQESPAIDFAVNLNEGCVPSTFIFTPLVNAPGVDLFWQFGDGQVSNQVGAVDHTYNVPGCYPVTLTSTNAAGCISTITYDDMVCVYANPIANFTADETIVPSDEPYVYFINNSLNAVTYLWDFADGSTSVSSDPIHLYPEGPATYYPVLTAYNEAGCSDQFTLPITLWEEQLFYVPNSFTPNVDGTNETFKPIITSGFDKGSYNLKIFNRWGEVVFESFDPDIGWDGTYGVGKYYPVQDVTYTWKITLRLLQNEDANVYVGHVNVLK
jgi:gliding motility-associated-like protein